METISEKFLFPGLLYGDHLFVSVIYVLIVYNGYQVTFIYLYRTNSVLRLTITCLKCTTEHNISFSRIGYSFFYYWCLFIPSIGLTYHFCQTLYTVWYEFDCRCMSCLQVLKSDGRYRRYLTGQKIKI